MIENKKTCAFFFYHPGQTVHGSNVGWIHVLKFIGLSGVIGAHTVFLDIFSIGMNKYKYASPHKCLCLSTHLPSILIPSSYGGEIFWSHRTSNSELGILEKGRGIVLHIARFACYIIVTGN